MNDDLTRVIVEALDHRHHLNTADLAAHIAVTLAPLIVARAWEAYLEGVRHGSDELDPEEFSDDIPAAVKAAIEALVQEARAVAWQEGYTSGHSNAMRRMSDEPNAPSTPNPYRAEEGDGNG